MRTKRTVAAAVLATVGLAAGVATAHETEYPSEVVVTDGGFAKGYAYAEGFIGSKANAKCRRFRAVELRAVNKGGPHQVIDEARTSRNGFFAMSGRVDKGYAAIVVKMFKENIGDDGHKHICTGDVELVDFSAR